MNKFLAFVKNVFSFFRGGSIVGCANSNIQGMTYEESKALRDKVVNRRRNA